MRALPRFLVALCLISAPLFAANDAALAAAGRAALEADQFEKAAELFQQAIKVAPNNARHHYYLGVAWGEIAQDAGVLKQASMAGKIRDEFERAVQLDPNFIDARFALIDFYTVAPGFMGGSMEKAMQQAAEIKRRNNVEGHRAYSRIYSRQKKADLARKELVDAVRENPNSARAHYLLGGVFINEKNWPAALQELETALRLDPNYMPTHYRLGAVVALSGQHYARGEESLRKYLAYKPAEQEPGHAWAWFYLGTIQEKQGKKAEAKASYTNAKKLRPQIKDFTEALKRVS